MWRSSGLGWGESRYCRRHPPEFRTTPIGRGAAPLLRRRAWSKPADLRVGGRSRSPRRTTPLMITSTGAPAGRGFPAGVPVTGPEGASGVVDPVRGAARPGRPGPHAIVFLFREPEPDAQDRVTVATRMFVDGPDVADLPAVLATLTERACEYSRPLPDLIAYLADRVEPRGRDSA